MAGDALGFGPRAQVAGGFDGHGRALRGSDFEAKGSVGFRGLESQLRGLSTVPPPLWITAVTESTGRTSKPLPEISTDSSFNVHSACALNATLGTRVSTAATPVAFAQRGGPDRC